MRAQHRRLLLQLLWSEREASRADLARATGLSRSTVSAIVADLLETGLVREVRAGRSTGGRRPIVLAFQHEAACIAGVELGASHVSAVLMDLFGNVLDHREVSCAVRDEPEHALHVVRDCVGALLVGSPDARRRLVGVGVAAPSPIDPKRPGRLVPTLIPAWEGIDVIERLQGSFGRPIFVDNDANAGALAERWWSEAPDGNLAYLKVATGIGAGLIVDGRILRGAEGVAGEIGHMTIDPGGPPCKCGLRGCLNTLVGTQQLLDRVRAMRPDHEPGPLHADPISLERLVAAASDGDSLACAVIREAGRTLGVGIANLLNLFNPQRVVLGGAITLAGDVLLDPIRQMISTRALAASTTSIERSPLGEHGIAIGAATVVLEHALAQPSMFDAVRLGVAS